MSGRNVTPRRLITIDDEMWKRIRHLAVDEGTSASEIIRRAVEEYLKKHKR